MGKSFAAVGRMMLRHEVPRDAAGISYFTLMALFPAFLITIALSDFVMGRSDFHQSVVDSIVNLFPGSRQYILSSLNEITAPSRTVLVSCIVVVFWASSWIFTFIESSINRAWDIPNQRTFWESRLRTFALMALGGISLLSSAAITAFVNTTQDRAAAHIGISAEASFFMQMVLVSRFARYRHVDRHTRFCLYLQMDSALQGFLEGSIFGRAGFHHIVGNRQLYFLQCSSAFLTISEFTAEWG